VIDMGKLRVMGAAEIAERLRVTRQRVYQITNRKGFPDPIAHLSMGQVWDTADVERWIAEHRPELDEGAEES
jgi:predicted DNA-binding transcriptional regulator AlpA